ncbi:flagellar motor switch protein FliN [Buchnera aphidicola]|nr:flagellar motor switch protein FliN [Buchnera aphidicola]
MGKSNNLHNDFKKYSHREKKINHFFKKDEMKILENINNFFINQIIIDFSNFFKKDVKLMFHDIKIELDSENNIKNYKCINLIEILPYKDQSFIIFSSSFLSFMTDFLFGGNGNTIDKMYQKKDMTSTDFLINKKITTLIIECLSNVYAKFFSLDIKFINVKVLIDFKQSNVHSNELFLINHFNFKINNIKIFFSILIPVSTIKKLNQKQVTSITNNHKLDKDKNCLNSFSFKNIYNVKIDITARIIDISIAYKKLNNLSVGDILSINKPNKIILFIENKPVFFAEYKRFNKQSIIFIKEFISNNLESNQYKENTLMSNIEEQLEEKSNNEVFIDSKENTHEYKNTDKNYLSQKNMDNKKILLDTLINVTVELGKTKIKIKDFLNLSKGSMLILDKLTIEPLDIFINDCLIASGEIVVLDKKYGLRITNVKQSLKTVNILP